MKRSIIVTAAVAVIALVGIYFVRLSLNEEKRASACYEQLAATLDSGVDPAEVFQNRLSHLQLLVEQSLVARSEMLVVSNRLRVDKDSPLSSRDLVTLKQGTEQYLDIR